ncbi:MFS transporter [Micromonospora fiedleri]|uniref:MFS transporter n=1 Tax=Micromonospora fiedleri TaxID=1157498 RepID=A0ABS1UKD3_9ACTN|nr:MULTISPECIES: MFS transporter [Micromonospora]MBL6276797.1 MFS transporter [Micromonospora fiedleri]WSK43495.1 MFS transporter [Micromonospora maris]
MSFTSGGSRWPDVGLATAARGIATCGDFLAATTLTLTLQSTGAGGAAVAGVLLAATLPLVLLAPLTGRLADRVDSRALLIGAGLAQSLICLNLAYARHPLLVVCLIALLATGLAVTQPVLSALIPAMVRPADLPRATALNQTAGTLGVLAGPALAGFLVGWFGSRVPLLVGAASYLALVVAGLLIHTRRGGARRSMPSTADAAGTPDGAAVGWRLHRDPLLVAMVATLAGVIAAVGSINVIEIFYVRETLGASAATYGLVTGAWTLGVLCGAWIFARLARRFTDDAALVQAGLFLLGGCCLMVLVSVMVPVALLLVPIWLIGGVCNGGNSVFNNLVLARRVPEAARGRAFAAMGAAVQGAAMVGYLIGGLLLEVSQPRPLIVGCGVAGLLVLLGFVRPVRRATRTDRSRVAAIAGLAGAGPAGAGLATSVPVR